MLKRIKSELVEIINEDLDYIKVDSNINDLTSWKVIMKPPPDSPYIDTFELSIYFLDDYPFTAPKVFFNTMIFHPNIDYRGKICVNILDEDWSPVLTMLKVLLSIYTLLENPNPYDPLNKEASKLFIENKNEYLKIAKDFNKK